MPTLNLLHPIGFRGLYLRALSIQPPFKGSFKGIPVLSLGSPRLARRPLDPPPCRLAGACFLRKRRSFFRSDFWAAPGTTMIPQSTQEPPPSSSTLQAHRSRAVAQSLLAGSWHAHIIDQEPTQFWTPPAFKRTSDWWNQIRGLSFGRLACRQRPDALPVLRWSLIFFCFCLRGALCSQLNGLGLCFGRPFRENGLHWLLLRFLF